MKYDRAIRAKAYEVGEPVWVFCRYIPQKGSPKLMRAWRGPHKVARVLQEGRVYILDTGQKVHFERLKPHSGGPTEWAAVPAHNGEVAIIMDPDPEQSHEEVRDDASQPSYRAEEPISEASNASLPSRQRHWMDTRLRTRMRAGGSRLHYQQFDYSSTESDNERSDVLLSSVQANTDESAILSSHVDEPAPFPEIPISPLPAMEALFSENEAVPDVLDIAPNPTIHAPTESAGTSLTGTSAPLLTNPSLTDMLSNFPIWPLIDDNVLNPTLDDNGAETPMTNDEKGSIPPATVPTNNNAATTTKLSNAPRGHGPQGRPPGRAWPRASLPRGPNREVLLEALAKQAVLEEDLLVQHTPDLTSLPVFVALHLWTLTLLPLAQRLPQIKQHRQNQPTLAMDCDAIVFPDIVAEHVAYETANVTTWSTRASQLNPRESC